MAQLSASVQVALRSAGTGGGVLPRAALHIVSSTRWVMSPDRAPDPSEINFQLYVFMATMVSVIPELAPA
jgi:hypothetical protein